MAYNARETIALHEGRSTNARRKYPLDDEEERYLVLNLAASQGLLVVLGFAGALVLTGFASGDWPQAVFGFGWIRSVVDAMTANLPYTAIAGLALACLFLAVAIAHAVYDFTELLIERRKMSHEPDYFHGSVPNRIILDAIEKEQHRDQDDR
ncbi:hypothetical protein [Raoultibacter phocaeensis]|uniref:hypothetical protein n=1 Tax=Raoultibacter phocaeensis TaxID=2479841 RepID=UPI00111994CD|nr:hypothetical protein [Raoultibacter phocaeensis]